VVNVNLKFFKMSRYFTEENDGGMSAEVFTISKDDTNHASKIRSSVMREKGKEFKRSKNELFYAKKKNKGHDKFPGRATIKADSLEKHQYSEAINPKRFKSKYAQKLAVKREHDRKSAHETAARTELLLGDDAGFIEGDSDDEFTGRVTQTQIKKSVDVESAEKAFELNLPQFGPYTIDYTRNGRFVALGGRKGHVAAIDWKEKKPLCEINVQESVYDVKWLHSEHMLAVAQKKWTYIYDNQGIELHCLKQLDNVIRMEFLPYHFLLATSSEYGFLSWIDISVGKQVAQMNANHGRLSIMCQNPTNAILCLGHSKGVVTMWSPNEREPVARMWAHKQPLTSIAVDRSGTYMATSAMDRSLKIWDVRMYKCSLDYKLPMVPSQIQFSDRRVLGVSMDKEVHLYKDACTKAVEYPYLKHTVNKSIHDIHFVPYEDVLGIGHSSGFSSILVPGCGEPNYDSLEVNPYQNKKQRREAEVKSLLEKIPSELISVNSRDLAEVNVEKLHETLEERKAKKYLKPATIEFEPKHKMKGKSGTVKRFHIKRTVQEERKWKQLKEQAVSKKSEQDEEQAKPDKKPKALLDRL